MIPILYEATETAFVSNGQCRLRDIISCVVTEERNGIYECDFEYPVTGAHYDLIQIGKIIAVEHDKTNDIQPFDIVSSTKALNGVVSFHAVHISYRLTGMTVSGTNINSLSSALTALASATPSSLFTYETDKSSTGYAGAFDGQPRSVRQMLGGVEGSILDAYGGEYEWDKWKVKLWEARGSKKDFTIRYGLNMLDFSDDTDYSESYTTAIPFWRGQDDNGLDVIVVGNKVDPNLYQYASREICIPLDVSDKFETQPTTAQVEAMALSMMLTESVNLPTQSITVEFVQLNEMGEYPLFANLFACKLCDRIDVVFTDYSGVQTFKIVKTVWNVLQERYDSLELGTLSTSLSDVIGAGSSSSSGGNVSLPYVLLAGSTMTGDLTMGTGTDINLTLESSEALYTAITALGWTDLL